MSAIRETNLPDLKLIGKGKVRDIYDLGETLLIVTTDRISAYDSVFPNAIPNKGKVLNQISNFWFDKTKGVVENHIIETDVNKFPAETQQYKDILKGRSIIVKKTQPLTIECVVRGYLEGSAWVEYQEKGEVCGVKLPSGLTQKSKLPQPIFTPATKAESGHDININFEQAADIVGKDVAQFVRDKSIEIFNFASNLVSDKEIIISDTKFEFGILDGKIILIDEVLTPDSSRFWVKDTYLPDRTSVSFDKQFVRDYVVKIGWDKNPPAPNLPEDIINKTAEKYQAIYKIITAKDLEI